MLYYFYNRGLDAILSTTGWLSLKTPHTQHYQLLAFSDAKQAQNAIKSNLKQFNKTSSRHTTILKQTNIKNRHPLSSTPQSECSVIITHFSELVQELQKLKNIKIVTSEDVLPVTLPKLSATENTQNQKIPSIETFLAPQIINEVPLAQFTTEPPLAQVTNELPLVQVTNEPPLTHITEEQQSVQTEEESQPTPIFYQQKQTTNQILRIQSQLSPHGNPFLEKSIDLCEKMEQVYEEAEKVSLTYHSLLLDIDAQIQDELHYIEFNSLTPEELLTFSLHLQELRIKRRMVKDSLYIAELLQRPPYQKLPNHFSEIASKLEHLKHRSYVLKSPNNYTHDGARDHLPDDIYYNT